MGPLRDDPPATPGTGFPAPEGIMRKVFVLSITALLSVALARPSQAAWPHSPFTNLPVCTARLSQYIPSIASDGAGGAIVVWEDLRADTSWHVFAHHVLASGVVDPVWPVQGQLLSTRPISHPHPQLVPDAAGGALVVWQDRRSGTNSDIYAIHVRGSGTVDPPADGAAVCTAAHDQISPMVAPDGSGGAIVTWQDLRSDTSYDIYAQHVLASGTADPAWPNGGRALCIAVHDQINPRIVSDGSGGAIVSWQDRRYGTDYYIYAQHVLFSGAVDPAWPDSGRILSGSLGDKQLPAIVADGAGGAIVTWEDLRNGVDDDIYAQHVLASGVVDPGWPVSGRGLCTAAGGQIEPTIVSDGSSGAVVSWIDGRGGASGIYAQHVLASGAVDGAWPLDGRALTTSDGVPLLVSDGAGGGIVSWMDYRNGKFDVFAQHVLAVGVVDPSWPPDGLAVRLAEDSVNYLAVTPDGLGGAILAWGDNRVYGDNDIYAQRIGPFGRLGSPEPSIVGVHDAWGDEGGFVKLIWDASYLDLPPEDAIGSYWVFRSIPAGAAASRLARGTRVVEESEAAQAVADGTLLRTGSEAQATYWEYVGATPAAHLAKYSCAAPTTRDSTAAGNPPTKFMVMAISGDGSQWWDSVPDSGYSVDNLAPAAPGPFTGLYVAGTAQLHWSPNDEPDLAGYRLYRGESVKFAPGPTTLVAAVVDTGYADAAGSPFFYKLTAVDVHGNESAVTTLLPGGALAVGDGALPRDLALAAPRPNPAAGATTLRYALPRSAAVRLAIYDAAGRRVRELAAGGREAGEHAVVWDLRDGEGAAVSAGLYFARLEADGATRVRRVAVTR
jgi:FlgD Ig-like domain